MKKTHWRKFFPSDYIAAVDFDPGERKVATISGVKRMKVKSPSGDEDNCLVVSFREPGIKPLIMNVTNSEAVEKVAGSKFIEDWIGVKIELYVQEGVKAFGRIVDAVRVKTTPPRIEKPVLTQSHQAWPKVAKAVAEGYTREQVEQKYTVSDEAWAALQPQEQEV